MQNILILGAGRSCTSLINYLAEESTHMPFHITIGDMDLALAQQKANNKPNTSAVFFNVKDEQLAHDLISKADLVISMLPATFHILVAKICAALGKSMLTASYATKEINALSDSFKEKGAMLVMEMGLDPGIDHMSAMRVLNSIREEGHELTSFETFTGGLLAPTTDNNPWEYKFTWNPRNVVLAGQGYVKFIQEGRFKYIPYHRLFRRTEVIHIPGHGYFEGYANRDSLKYIESYQLQNIKTMYRGTLRRPGFCKSWDVFVQLGATDDTFEMENVAELTHRQFINSFLSFNPHDSVELKLAHYLQIDMESDIMYRLRWLDLFEEIPVGLDKGTPAQVLEHILKKKWTMKPDEKDMIVMWHKFDFLENGVPRQIQSSMVVEGENSLDTAMSKTVGLPLGVTAKLWLEGKFDVTGVVLPTEKAIYAPVLEALEPMGVVFNEYEVALA